MERYVITMGDFLKNAGIVGMEYLLETAGARRDVDYGITEDAQGLWLNRKFAEDAKWTDMAFKAFVEYFGSSTVYQGVMDRIGRCLDKITEGEWSPEKAEKEDLKFINDKLLSNSYQAGFENINVDLMSALPGQTVESWEQTLMKAAELAPEHLSAYSLIIEEGTPFWSWYGEDANQTLRPKEMLPLPSEEDERRMYARTREILEQYGYHRYEISNYAKDGYACRHNIGYWNRTDYLGIGLGASSLIDPMRWKMTSDLSDYLECGKNQGDFANLREEVQTLRESERMEEFMFLGLRLTKGIELQTFEHQFGKSFWDVYQDAADKLFSEQLLCLDESKKNLRLTDYGVDVSNYALAEFLLDY